MSAEVFWSCTMRTLVREFVVADTRRLDEHDRDMRLAWHIAALQRQKKLPDEKKLRARRVRGRQTLREQFMVVKTLSEQYGIPVRRVVRRRG
jgi:hypothetical protein